MLRLPPWTLFSRILIPAALPEIVTGIRVGFSLALIGTLLLVAFAAGVNALLLALDRRLHAQLSR